MSQPGYPRKNNHISDHQTFNKDLSFLASEYKINGIELSVKLLNTQNRFCEHTQTTDKLLAKFLTQYEDY